MPWQQNIALTYTGACQLLIHTKDSIKEQLTYHITLYTH